MALTGVEITMLFAKRNFLIAGVYGLVVLLPQYLLEARIGRDFPPAITHPEYYYGFIGVAVAWQIAFFVLAKDPVRYRPMMIPAIIEKATFGIAVGVLFALDRVSLPMLGAGFVDLVLFALFISCVSTDSAIFY
jgi:hypothetical protein